MQHLRCSALIAISLSLCASTAVATDPGQQNAIRQLTADTVSRLEWGLEKLRRALLDNFAIDPLSLEPSSPPFFVNVTYKPDTQRIEIEIGRTYPSISEPDARAQCHNNIRRVRSLLAVGMAGAPAIGGASSLAEDFFRPLDAAAPQDINFAKALDQRVDLRSLVASPINGVFSICTASLVYSPIRDLQ